MRNSKLKGRSIIATALVVGVTTTLFLGIKTYGENNDEKKNTKPATIATGTSINKSVTSEYQTFEKLLGTNKENITKIFVRNGMDGNSIVINDKNKINEFINLFCTFKYSKSLNQEAKSGYSYFADFYSGENKLMTLTYVPNSTIKVDTVRYDTNKEVNIDKLGAFFNSFPITKWPDAAK